MALYHENIVDIELTCGNIHRSFAKHSIGSGDAAANRFGVRIWRNGEAVNLTGVTCEGFFKQGSNAPIALTSYGTVSGNTAYVTLPQACYNYEGQFVLAIKLVSSSETSTVRIVDGVVDNTHTGGAVAPTESIPTYQEIMALYDEMVDATEAAEAAANKAVRYDEEQELTDAEQAQGRENIGVPDPSTMFLNSYILADNSDLNDIAENCVVFVQNGASHIPDNYPEEFGDDAATIITSLATSNTNFRSQIAIRNTDGLMLFRSKVSTGWRDWSSTAPKSTVFVRGNVTSFGGENDEYSSLADLPDNSYFRTTNAPDRPDGQSAGSGFWVLTLKTDGASNWTQFGFGAQSGIISMRWKATGQYSTYSDWVLVSGQKKHIRVLCLGNSYTQDDMSYVPFVLRRIAPDIAVTMGISYYSGAKISDYISFFDNDTRVLMYSKITPSATAWTTWGINTTEPADTQKTIKEILADEPWDIITIQQGSAYMANWSYFSGLNEWVDDIITYLRSQGLRHVRIGWLMPQMRKPQEYVSPTTYTYEKMIECVEQVIATSPLSFVIPCGTAIENARHTSLDSLGAYSSDAPDEKGHLCYDTNGHLQEGLPCLCAAYAGCLKLLELFGEPWIGILGENTWPNDDWRSGKNIPIPHGSAVGMNATSLYLAQKCAVAANKKPYEVTEIT